MGYSRNYFILIFSLFLVGIGPCPSPISGPVKYGGYVKDIATNTVLTSYTMTVETANGSDSVEIDSSTGKFEFGLPAGTDYTVTIAKEGYRSFVSTNRWSPLSTTSHEVNENQRFLYVAPMIPTTLKSPEITGKVLDALKGSSLTSGAYRAIATGLESGFQASLYSEGSVVSSQGLRVWLADGGVFSGSFATGEFLIPADSLMPGYTYSVTVYGVSGYRDQKIALTLATSTLDSAKNVNVEMVALNQSSAPTLIAQSTVGPAGNIPISSDRVITFTFDRDVTMYKNGLKGLGADSASMISASTTNSDSDGNTTSTTIASETVLADSYSTRIIVSAFANQVTITLAADATLISGTIDTDDDLSYTLGSTLLNNVLLRDATSVSDNFVTLNSLITNATNKTIIVRATFPP